MRTRGRIWLPPDTQQFTHMLIALIRKATKDENHPKCREYKKALQLVLRHKQNLKALKSTGKSRPG